MVANSQDIETAVNVILNHSEYDFRDYHIPSLERRFAKITESFQMSMGELVSRMEADREFLENIVKEITITTTEIIIL